AEWHSIVCYRRRIWIYRYIIAVNEIHISAIQRGVQPATLYLKAVPSHVRNLHVVLRKEPLHRQVENAETGSIILFRMGTQQLHTQANAHHRLPERTDKCVQLFVLQISHGVPGLADTRKDYLIRAGDGFGVVGNGVFDTKPVERKGNGLDVARV